MRQTDEAHQRLVEALQGSNHGHGALRARSQLALDVVPLVVLVLVQVFGRVVGRQGAAIFGLIKILALLNPWAVVVAQ